MTTDLSQERGQGPEIVGTRLTVYNLFTEFLDPTATEAHICRLYGLTPEQVASDRAYVLNNPDTVLARHLEIEERLAVGNPPYYSHYKIAEIFMQSAKKALKPGGRVMFVTKKTDWFVARMGQLFKNVKVQNSRTYFVVSAEQTK